MKIINCKVPNNFNMDIDNLIGSNITINIDSDIVATGIINKADNEFIYFDCGVEDNINIPEEYNLTAEFIPNNTTEYRYLIDE